LDGETRGETDARIFCATEKFPSSTNFLKKFYIRTKKFFGGPLFSKIFGKSQRRQESLARGPKLRILAARGASTRTTPSPQISTLLISTEVADPGRLHRTGLREILPRDIFIHNPNFSAMAGDASARTSIENVRAHRSGDERRPSPQISIFLTSPTIADGERLHRTGFPEILARDIFSLNHPYRFGFG
jgi:hypothetical protein